MGLTIAPPRGVDLPHLQAMLIACGSVFSEGEIGMATRMMDEAMEGHYTMLAATVDGELVGYCLAGATPFTNSTWHLYWLCVHPNKQRLGVGQVLLQSLEAHVRAAGGERIVLETGGRADYVPAQHFYRASGYLEMGRIPDYYRPGDDCIYFCKAV